MRGFLATICNTHPARRGRPEPLLVRTCSENPQLCEKRCRRSRRSSFGLTARAEERAEIQGVFATRGDEPRQPLGKWLLKLAAQHHDWPAATTAANRKLQHHRNTTRGVLAASMADPVNRPQTDITRNGMLDCARTRRQQPTNERSNATVHSFKHKRESNRGPMHRHKACQNVCCRSRR